MNEWVMVRYSDDGGRTWSAEQWRELPVEGDYLARVILNAQGSAYNRVYELTTSANILPTVLDGWADMEFAA